MLLHGFGGSTALQWEHALRTWSSRYRVIAPDLLWFGESSSQDPDPSLDHQARAMLDVAQALDVTSMQLVGLSYGGMVAEEIVQQRAELVRSRVTVDSPANLWSRADHAAMLARFAADHAAEIFVPETPEGVRRLLSLAYHHPPRIPRSTARTIVENMYDPHRDALTALLTYLEDNLERLVARPSNHAIPSLVVWGEEDDVFPVDVGRRLAAHQGARFETIPNTKHLPIAEAPETFDAIVLPHLALHA